MTGLELSHLTEDRQRRGDRVEGEEGLKCLRVDLAGEAGLAEQLAKGEAEIS